MLDNLLTVAIPTYNRPETLLKLLEALKIESIKNNFIIQISDDSTNNDVQNLVKEYSTRIPNLHYVKNEKNLGFNLNVAQLYSLAKTTYIWFLCDDDMINPGIIESIIKGLRLYEPAVAIYNCSWEDSYGRVLYATKEVDRLFDDIDNFNDYNPIMRTAFLSITIMKTGYPIEQITKLPDCRDNVFIQITLALQILSDNFRLMEYGLPILHRNVGYKYGEFFKFVLMDPLKAIHLLPHKFDNNKLQKWMVSQLPNSGLLFLSQKLGIFHYKGMPTWKTIKGLIKYYGLLSIPIFLFRFVCIFIPSMLLKLIFRIKLLCIYRNIEIATDKYNRLKGRAYKDSRKTGFTEYR